MFTNTFLTSVIARVTIVAAIMFIGFIAVMSAAQAATYAYVDAAGDVKSVDAVDWKTAIAVAPNIHIHSGVMLLTTAADYTVVGDSVAGY